MIDDSTGYLSDLSRILENVNFKGTNFKMPHSIFSVAIHNQTGNTLGRYSQLLNPYDPNWFGKMGLRWNDPKASPQDGPFLMKRSFLSSFLENRHS